MERQFTTPLQSKSLMDMGISVDTADYSMICSSELPTDWRQYRGLFEPGIGRPWFVFRSLLENRTYTEESDIYNKHGHSEGMMMPSWSFGRLVEMYEYCTGAKYKHNTNEMLVYDIIDKIHHSISFAWFHRFNFDKMNEYKFTKPIDYSPRPRA